jgi:hypothetical protein
MHTLRKYTVKEAKSQAKNLISQSCAEGFNSGFKGSTHNQVFIFHLSSSYKSTHK